MDKQEAIERLKQNKAAAKFYAGMVQNTNAIENELKDIEALDMAIEALSADAVQGEWEFVDNEIFAGEYFCSVCGKRAEVDLYGEWILSNCCPSCGAIMENKE